MTLARAELRKLVLPGQRTLHMKQESERRRKQIIDVVEQLVDHGLRLAVYDAGRAHPERQRRDRCLEALLRDIDRRTETQITLDRDESLVTWDRQLMIERTRALGLRGRVTYRHASLHEEIGLIIPDAVAWSWARGGEWRRRVQPLTNVAQEV
ncbi:MAG: hypothetical protein QM621_00090 [Aeromicrobium sp.]|uniref:hypothetical protein n=1 Tax=Aeromicrobium sp. TaxID=1871063 RepID=UPI0039E41C29